MSQRVKTSFIGKYQLSWLLLQTIFVVIILEVALAVPTSASPLAVGGTGPGGVGVTTGGDTLELWLQSDKLVYSDSGCTTPQTTDGGMVGCWRDYSGNTNHVVQPTAANRPTFQNGSGDTLNAHPMLRWDGSNDFLGTSGTVGLGPFTVFVVFNAANTGFIYEHNLTSFSNGGSYLLTDVDGTHSVTRLPGPTESWRNLSSGWGSDGNNRIVAQTFNGTNASHNMYINGALQTTTPGNTANPGLNVINATLYIGARGTGTPVLPVAGNYTEFVLYSEALNSAQRLLVFNYLQAKFNDSTIDNISLGVFDRYDGDTTANGDFDIDVAGIGQEADGSHTEAHSAGMIVQNVAGATGFLQDDGDYLMFGHRTLTADNTTGDIPTTGVWLGAPAPQRWTRHWEITVTDVVGTANGVVNIIFDFSEGGMDPTEPPAGPASNYRLIGRSGPSGQFADVMGATSVSTDQVIFSGVDVSLLGSNFTLGTLNADVSPTVVEMKNAAALPLSLPPVIAGLAVLMLGGVTLVLLRRGRNA